MTWCSCAYVKIIAPEGEGLPKKGKHLFYNWASRKCLLKYLFLRTNAPEKFNLG
jgi:hypothetical protein